jgi:uncharacterized protein involved in response to NO
MPTEPHLIRSEPFRIFFPIGIVLGFIGVSHWGWYYSGLTDTYSCNYHGLMQIQGFEFAFVAGFSMTALPRFLETPPARWWEFSFALLLLLGASAGLYFEDWTVAEYSSALLASLLLYFSLSRYLTRQDDPPAEFALIPLGLAFALVGALLVLHPIDGFLKLGQRLVEQATLLCFLLAYGSYLGPRLIHGKPPAESDRSGSPPTRTYLIAVGIIFSISFLIESAWSEQAGRLLRATSLTAYAPRVIPILSLPSLRRFSAWVLWSGFWYLLAGQWLAGIFPDYEIVALHLTFIGGFSTITLVIATHVISAHCGPETMLSGKARAFKSVGLFLLAALVSRATSDFMPGYYFGMLHVAAGFWMVGALIWGFAYIPKLTRREDD